MKREISSKDTFFYKIILPVFFLICAAVLPAVVYLDDRNIFAAVLPSGIYSGDRDGHFSAALFVFLLLFGCATLIFLMTKKTKKVSLDDSFLYVSNYLKEIAVPVSNIAKIIWFNDTHPVMVYLKTPSEFGKKINFFPNIRATSSESHPIVEELKELAKIKE